MGTHSITTVYGADTNFSGSTSAPFLSTVAKADTTTTVSSSPNPSVFGQSVTITATVVGDRPAGSISRDHQLVQLATAAYRSIGAQVSYEAGSTDANIPLSRGIPAVCVAIGEGEHAHRLDEYIEPTRVPLGMRALLLLTLAATTAP